jgi:transposase
MISALFRYEHVDVQVAYSRNSRVCQGAVVARRIQSWKNSNAERSAFQLKPTEVGVLKEFHPACRDKKTGDRIKIILLLANGFSYAQIRRILLIDERTVTERSTSRKASMGWQKTTTGGVFKLTDERLSLPTKELDRKLFASAAEVCTSVWKHYHIRSTPQGMVKTLHRMGYSYKQTNSW